MSTEKPKEVLSESEQAATAARAKELKEKAATKGMAPPVETDADKIKRQDDEITKLKERIVYLEHGEGFVQRADEYAKIVKDYEDQVKRASDGLEAQRAYVRQLEEINGLREKADRAPPSKRKGALSKLQKAKDGVIRERKARAARDEMLVLKEEANGLRAKVTELEAKLAQGKAVVN